MTEKGDRHTFKRADIIDELVELRVKKGYTRTDLLKHLVEKHQYAQSTAYDYIRRAKEEFNERAIYNFGEDLKEDIERFEALYSDALKNGNRKEARENLKEIAKLKGHYTERVELTGEMAIKGIEIRINKPNDD